MVKELFIILEIGSAIYTIEAFTMLIGMLSTPALHLFLKLETISITSAAYVGYKSNDLTLGDYR